MSSLFISDWHTRPVRWSLALAALLACGTAAAQEALESEDLAAAVEGRAYTGTTPLRIEHRTRGYAQEASDTAVGGRLGFVDMTDAVGFADGQFRVNNESRVGVNTGLGYRWYNESFLTGDTRILGVSGWYDGQETVNDNYFNQLGVSFESLGEFIDLRLNANIPLEDQKLGGRTIMTDEVNFFSNFIGQQTFTPTDTAIRVVDFEAAARVFDLNIWVYGGGYQMDGEGISETGAKGGVRGYLTNDLLVGVTVTDDEVFGTNTIAQVIWTPGRVGSGPTSWVHNLADRMREHVYRNTYVATQQTLTEGSLELTDADGDAFRVVHVNNNATGPGAGDGTFENPYKALTSVNGGGSQQGDIILVHAGSDYTGQTVTLKDEQRFLGEGMDQFGDFVAHTIVTSERGTIDLPLTRADAETTARPIINGAVGQTLVTIAGTNEDTSDFDAVEISNFTMDGGQTAIASAGVGAVNINELAISDMTGNAIDLTALTEQLDGGTERVRFTPTIDDIAFTNVAGNNIVLNSGTEAASVTTNETITVSDITSTGGSGIGIDLQNTRRTANLSNITWTGGATGEGGIRVQDAGTQAAIVLNGENEFTGGVNNDPEDDEGFAIALLNSSGTMTVTGTDITGMGGDSIIVNGEDIDLNFTGRIVQETNDASILSVTGDHDGALTFVERTSDDGVIRATMGDGLQFDDADGVYTFTDEVELVGTSQAVNVQNADSEAAITVANGVFTDTTGTTITFNGGEAGLAFTGRIEQSNAATVLSVSGGHTGTLSFTELTNNAGVIEATNGAGLQFANADGAYTFNDEVILNGVANNADTGIDISAGADATNGSDGTFTFANANIDYDVAGGAAVSIDGSSVQAFTLSGDIDIAAGDAGRVVAITDNTGGSITFNATIDSNSEGILVGDNDADAVNGNSNTTIRFAGQTTLNTGGNTGVELVDNANGSIRFDALDVTTTTGTAFTATNTDELTVQGSGNTITTTGGAALVMNDVSVGTSGVTFQTVNSTGGANAISLTDVTGGPVTINGGTLANNTAAAVVANDVANLVLNSVMINGSGAEGIDFNVTDATTSRLALSAVNISNTQLEGVSVNANVASGASTINLRIVNSTISNVSADEAVRLDTTGAATKTVNMLVSGSNISNDDATAPAANFQIGQATNLNATVTNNTFNNTDATPGRPFEMASNTGSSIVRLNLNGNNASAVSGAEYFLEENAGSFSVEDRDDADANNGGEIDWTPPIANFGDDPGGIPTPP